jgi:hypothetical protein
MSSCRSRFASSEKEVCGVGKIRLIQVLIIVSAVAGLVALRSTRPRPGVLTTNG